MAWQGTNNRGGLSARAHLMNQQQDQVQIRIDPGNQLDFDSEVEGLSASIRGLKHLTQAIDEERKLQGDQLNAMEDVMERTKLALGHTMRRMNVAYKQAQSWHLLWIVVFAVVLFTTIFVLSKLYRIGRVIVG